MGLACYWWSRAARHVPDAAANLGAALWNGEVAGPDGSGGQAARRAAAVGWYRVAALQGHASAQRHFADALLTATPSSSTEAVALGNRTSATAEGGNPSGKLYPLNVGGGSSADWEPSGGRGSSLEAATEAREADASGTGSAEVDADSPTAEAARWYAAAAAQGDAPAAFSLGILFESGVGGRAPDACRAAEWHARAARLGFQPAHQSLAALAPALAAAAAAAASAATATNADAARREARGLPQAQPRRAEPQPLSSTLLPPQSSLPLAPACDPEGGWLTPGEAAASMAAALARARFVAVALKMSPRP
jgi:hypothetical protein